MCTTFKVQGALLIASLRKLDHFFSFFSSFFECEGTFLKTIKSCYKYKYKYNIISNIIRIRTIFWTELFEWDFVVKI